MVILEYSLVQTLKALNLLYSENEILKIKEDLKNELEFPRQRELTCKCVCSYHRWLFKSEVKVIVRANLLLAMPASVSTKCYCQYLFPTFDNIFSPPVFKKI